MKVDKKATVVLQSSQTDAERETLSSTFRVQTGVRAGGFYDWWAGVAEGFNAADRASTAAV